MTTRGEREEDVWLSDEQLSKLARADDVDDLHSPVPTRMISNGEYMPVPQTDEQKRVEARSKNSPTRRATGSASAGGSSSAARAAWRPRCSP